jgi:tRNA(adenine34) deaminase
MSTYARVTAGCHGQRKLRRFNVAADTPLQLCNSFNHCNVPEMMIDLPGDEHFMREALRQAQKAYEAGEVPVGAIVVRAGRIIARAWNQVELLKDATAHAEMLALTQAETAVGDWRLTDCDLYVTKEPCVMCAGALVHVRMGRVVFGCADLRSGGAGGIINLLQHPALNHRCDISSGVLQNECATILQDFFRKKRGRTGDTTASVSEIDIE